MSHDHDDATIGAYLAGELPGRPREQFETHLLTCDRCWAEVDTARRGRTLAQLAREPVPAHLAARLAETITGQPTPPGDTVSPRRFPSRPGRPRNRLTGRARRAWAGPAAAVLVLAVALAGLITGRDAPAPPAPQVTVAVDGYHHDRLPGTTVPARPGPDLSALNLSTAGAGAGTLAGQHVTGYAYRDSTARRLTIYLSDTPFPMPAQAENPIGDHGAGIVHHDGVVVLCSRSPHTALILGDDEDLVRQAATTLNLI